MAEQKQWESEGEGERGDSEIKLEPIAISQISDAALKSPSFFSALKQIITQLRIGAELRMRLPALFFQPISLLQKMSNIMSRGHLLIEFVVVWISTLILLVQRRNQILCSELLVL